MAKLRKNSSLVALTATAVLLAGTATQSVASTEDLLRECKLYSGDAPVSHQEAVTASACFSYVRGFHDGWTTGSLYKYAITGMERFKICFPEVSYLQLIKVFVKWGDDHPELLHHERWQALRAAWVNAFPCR
jgi:hypothetical protein